MKKNAIIHHFDVFGMTCDACVQTIINILKDDGIVDDINIDFALKRATVTLKEGRSLSEVFNNVSDLGFTFKSISLDSPYIFYLAIKGLLTEDVSKIDTIFDKQKIVESCVVDSSTCVATITCYANNEQSIVELKQHVKSKIKEAVTDHDISVDDIEPLLYENNDDKSWQYFPRAMLNGMVALLFVLFGQLIPPPLTLGAQLLGVFIGGATLSLMWKTGKEFYLGAWVALKHKRSDMNTLIALGTGSAWTYSMLLAVAPMLFPAVFLSYQFMAVLMILGIINVGKGIRARAQEEGKKDLQTLEQTFRQNQPPRAMRIKNYKAFSESLNHSTQLEVESIDYCKVDVGDMVYVGKGKRFPVDGQIIFIEGSITALIDQAGATGESKVCKIGLEQRVISGTLNCGVPVILSAEVKGEDGHLTKIIKGVAQSSLKKAPISNLVDKIAAYFAPLIICLAIASSMYWGIVAPTPELRTLWMIKSFMSVLSCACPCALLLATPFAVSLFVYKLLLEKIIVVDASRVESLAKANVIYFDKTGTLTQPSVAQITVVRNGEDKVDALARLKLAVSSLETAILKNGGTHPIAKSLILEVNNLPACSELKTSDKGGVQGNIEGMGTVYVGHCEYLKGKEIQVDEVTQSVGTSCGTVGWTSVYVAIDGKCIGVIGLKHTLRPDAKATIQRLHEMGIKVCMLTGDYDAPSQKIAEELGISKENVFSKMSVADKKQKIQEEVKKGSYVIFVGDGENDLPALDESSVGIALGSATSAAGCAHVVIQNLEDLVRLIIASKATMRNIFQNITWAALYNILSLTAAAGLLLSPIPGSLLMMISSMGVIVNSNRSARHIATIFTHEKAQTEKENQEKPREEQQEFVLQQVIDVPLTTRKLNKPSPPNSPTKKVVPSSNTQSNERAIPIVSCR